MGFSRRIAALALFGVQLLQGVLPAAGANCDLANAAEAALSSPPAAMIAVHHHGASAVSHPAPDVTTNRPAPTPDQRPHAPAACPMAMACAVVGIVSSAVIISTLDVAVDVYRPRHVADWPVSLDIAPEPPPPRG